MKFIELESERLIYRKFKQEDLPIYIDWCGNLENNKYKQGEPSREADILDWFNSTVTKSDDDEYTSFHYAVELKADNNLIGEIFLFNLSNDPEVGWDIHRDYWQQGYGTEMGKTILKFGFEILDLRRIISGCNAKNIGSFRIMEKIGMRREAHFIKAQRGNSALNYEWCDRFQYAILREEWAAARQEYKHYAENA